MQLNRIRIYPIKSLEGLDVDQCGFTSAGALQNDRRWCLSYEDSSEVTPDSVFMTKSEPSSVASRLMQIRVRYGDSPSHLSLEAGEKLTPDYSLPGDAQELSTWLSEHLDLRLRLIESAESGWPDTFVYGDEESSAAASGPTVISTSTLNYLSERLEVSPEDLFLRFRTNLWIHDESLPPFGEDQLKEIQLGDVKFAVAGVVTRCPVPARDIASGEYDRGFAKRLIEAKLETEFGKALPQDKIYSASVFTKVLDPTAVLKKNI